MQELVEIMASRLPRLASRQDDDVGEYLRHTYTKLCVCVYMYVYMYTHTHLEIEMHGWVDIPRLTVFFLDSCADHSSLTKLMALGTPIL